MSNVSQRITGLSPEKRKLLEQLIKEKESRRLVEQHYASTPEPTASAADERRVSPSLGEMESESSIAPLAFDPNSPTSHIKVGIRTFYNGVNDQLNSTVFSEFSFFLNYGYVPDHNAQASKVELPDYYINKNSVRLVLELIGDCELTGRRVLDVGCGRGGSIHVMNKFFKPESTVGVDLSSSAIAFCKKNHRYARVNFLEVDAEQLSFADESFDIVTNVESSHSYPNIHAFYHGVRRVLKPGGYFLYTDLMATSDLNRHAVYLKDNGFTLEREQDITTNILLSCDEIAQVRGQAFESQAEPESMSEFLAMPGSQAYYQLSMGFRSYKIFRFKKK
jgi:phthiocerol/phenolphthiocerol synthesis type-I polyketide synthase E